MGIKWDHIVKCGKLVTPADTYKANIYIKDGKIAAITAEELPGEAMEVTDANGKYVLPGLIDTHVHSRDGYNGAHYKEGFFYSTMAAACGGITTIYEMPNCNPAIYCVDTMRQLIDCVTPKAHVDFGIWGQCLGELNNHELQAMADAGVVGFKFFWGYAIDSKSYQLIYNYDESMKDIVPPLDIGQVYCMFEEIQKTGKLVAIHAESFEIIKRLTKRIRAGGDDGYAAMLRSRPAMGETMIVETAIAIARELGVRLHILHVSAGNSVDVIRRAKAEGLAVTAETCPHYLTLTDEDIGRLGAVGKGYPLVRTKYDQDLIWGGVNDGTINCVCSDHAPHTVEEKSKGLWDSLAGIAGTESMSMLLLNAVNDGQLTLNDFVDVLSEQPARIYGMYPQKGSLAVGTDADIAIVDMETEYVLHKEDLHSRVKLSPYDGRKLKGKVVQTILRGTTIMKAGSICTQPMGRFVRPESR